MDSDSDEEFVADEEFFAEVELHIQGPLMRVHQCQEVTLAEGASYLNQIKYEFANQPQVYNDFVDIMTKYMSRSIDTPGVIKKVSNLFQGHPELLADFNIFMPLGYSCEVQPNEQVQVGIPGTNLGSGATSAPTLLASHPGGPPTITTHSTLSHSSPGNAVDNHPIYRLQYTLKDHKSTINHQDERDQSVWSVKFSPTGEFIASAGDGIIRVWNAARKVERELVCNDDIAISEVDWSKDGSLLVSTGAKLKLWNVNTEKCVRTFRGHELYVFSAKFNHDDSLILSGSDDCTIRIWDTKYLKCVHKLEGPVTSVVAVDFYHDGSRFITTRNDGNCHVYDMRCMKIVYDLTTVDRIVAAKFSPDSRYILFSMQDYSLRLYDIRKQKVTGIYKRYDRNRPQHFEPNCSNFALTTSGKYIVSGLYDSLIYIWDVNTQGIVELLEGHSGAVECVDCHPKNDIIVSGSEDNSTKIWKSF